LLDNQASGTSGRERRRRGTLRKMIFRLRGCRAGGRARASASASDRMTLVAKVKEGENT
jgi:hypothetical protein